MWSWPPPLFIPAEQFSGLILPDTVLCPEIPPSLGVWQTLTVISECVSIALHEPPANSVFPSLHLLPTLFKGTAPHTLWTLPFPQDIYLSTPLFYTPQWHRERGKLKEVYAPCSPALWIPPSRLQSVNGHCTEQKGTEGICPNSF